MVEQSGTDQPGIRARQVPQSIRFLRELGVPATRLAAIFSDTADNIRHIYGRSVASTEQSLPAVLDADDLALVQLTSSERRSQFRRNIQGLRLRSKQDLDQVEASVWTILQNHKSMGLQEGFDALLMMLPSMANGRHGQALRIRLLMEEKLAWFALPLDRIPVAFFHASRAMELAVDAFRESAGETGYLLRYAEAALVASICLQKMHRSEAAFEYIRAADQACRAAGQLPGSEHLRQRGASFIHMGVGYDEHADKALIRAGQRMALKNEALHPVDLAMNSVRQRAFLDPGWGWDKSLELIGEVKASYGDRSMQYAVAAKSAALVGLKLAIPETTEMSLNLLRAISPSDSSGVTSILAITPDLKLSPEERDAWLRFAMNETPLSRRK